MGGNQGWQGEESVCDQEKSVNEVRMIIDCSISESHIGIPYAPHKRGEGRDGYAQLTAILR
jgi:hypothetical protein